MTRIRTAVVKTLKSCLAIVGTCSYFYSIENFRKIIMIDSITTATLSPSCYNYEDMNTSL
jgi:hypothetical protein